MVSDREPVAVVSVRAAEGSTPREVGAAMIVTPSGIEGTIGGGEAERRAIEAARALLNSTERERVLTLSLGPAMDQCCGGRLTLSVQRVDDADAAARAIQPPHGAPLLLFGAGHVGAALYRALQPLPFAVTWIDGRSATSWPTPIAAPCHRLAMPEEAAAAAPPEAIHIVMTHSHALDLEIVATALGRPHGFVGLIGSATKRATFVRRLAERGIDPAPLVCPIGLPGIEGKAPAVIAASVAAQLLALPGEAPRNAASDRRSGAEVVAKAD